jgi:SAM-dependent methyltransferase
VFTHLLHEETFNYLREAKRVLKPNGKIVFSFLEFYIPSHWNVFEYDIEHLGDEKHLNVFFGRDAISAWANHLNLEIESIFYGDKPFINLSNSITKEDGTVFENKGALGQSVCVLIKR